MVQKLFGNIDEIRPIISDTGDVPTVSDEALRVLLKSCESDVNFALGGPNSIGAEFDGEEDVEIEVVKSGDNLNTGRGNPGPITQLTFQYTDGTNFGILTVDSYSASFISGLSHHDSSSYLLYGEELYEFSALYGATVTDLQFRYQHIGVAAEHAFMGLNDMQDGDSAGFVVARPDAYIKASAIGLTDVKRQAVIELITLRMNYDALQSMRDGTYSRVSADYAKERARILKTLQERIF